MSIASLPALVCHLRDRRRHDDWWPAPHFVPIMVVTRKAPLPPTPSSRSSSSQAVPRMAKLKVNQLNQPEHSSPLANGKPRTADFTVSYCSHAHSTHRLCKMDVDGSISYPPTSIKHHLITNFPVLQDSTAISKLKPKSKWRRKSSPVSACFWRSSRRVSLTYNHVTEAQEGYFQAFRRLCLQSIPWVVRCVLVLRLSKR